MSNTLSPLNLSLCIVKPDFDSYFAASRDMTTGNNQWISVFICARKSGTVSLRKIFPVQLETSLFDIFSPLLFLEKLMILLVLKELLNVG